MASRQSAARAVAEDDDILELGPAGRRRNAQRQRIIVEAGKLFEANGGEKGGGHDKTTVEVIAARSDISVRTFFRYFKSKTDVIYLDTERAMRDHLALVERWLQTKPPGEASLAALAVQLTDSMADAADVGRFKRSLGSQTYMERRGSFRPVWKDGLAALLVPHLQRRQNAELHAALIAGITLEIRETALGEWHRHGGKIDIMVCLNEALAGAQSIYPDDLPTKLDPKFDYRRR